MKRLTLMTAMLVFALAGTAFAAENATPAAPGQTVDAKAPDAGKKKRPKVEDCDADKDGFLSREEFAVCYPRAADRFDAMDANRDGKLTRDEIKTWRKANKKPRRSFEDLDTNKDGFLSREEAVAAHPKKADKFDRMDADKDGKLSKEEIQAWRDAKKKNGKGKEPRKDAGM